MRIRFKEGGCYFSTIGRVGNVFGKISMENNS
jgi:hypothetical protein